MSLWKSKWDRFFVVRDKAGIEAASRRIGLWTVIFCCAFVPLVFYPHWVPMKGDWNEFWLDQASEMDSYSWAKSKLLMLSGLVLVGTMLASAVQARARELSEGHARAELASTEFANKFSEWAFSKEQLVFALSLFGLAFLYLLSALTADHPMLAFLGYPGRYEGLLIHFCYFILSLAALFFVRDRRSARVLLCALLGSSLLISLTGMMQFWGHDFWATGIGRWVGTLGKLAEFRNSLKFPANDGWNATSLYNTNYVGSYMAMLMPICVGLCFAQKEILVKGILGGLSVVFFLQLYASYSRAGLIATGAGLFLMALIGWKDSFKQWKVWLCLGVSYGGVVFGMNMLDGGRNIKRLNLAGAEVKGASSKDRYVSFEKVGLGAKMVTQTETLVFQTDGQKIWFEKSPGEKLEAEEKNFVITLKDPIYKDYSFVWFEDVKTLRMHRGDDLLFWSVQPNGLFVKGFRNKLHPVEEIPQWVFHGRDAMMSGRAFIWSRSLPLLKDTLWLGKGPDTYPAYFPQGDFRGQLNVLGKMTWIVDKPHNFYIQISHAAGLPALVVFLALMIWLVLRLVGFRETRLVQVDWAKLGLGAALGAYCLSVIFNDSLVSVAPVFWTLVGVGFRFLDWGNADGAGVA